MHFAPPPPHFLDWGGGGGPPAPPLPAPMFGGLCSEWVKIKEEEKVLQFQIKSIQWWIQEGAQQPPPRTPAA